MDGLHGYVVDFEQRGGPQQQRGWPPSEVRLMVDARHSSTPPRTTRRASAATCVAVSGAACRLQVDGHWHNISGSEQTANISRPDIEHAVPGCPNAEHGFAYTFAPDFFSAAGKHRVQMRVLLPGGKTSLIASGRPDIVKCVCARAECPC